MFNSCIDENGYLVLTPYEFSEKESKKTVQKKRYNRKPFQKQFIFLNGFEPKKYYKQEHLNFQGKSGVRTYTLRPLKEVLESGERYHLTEEEYKSVERVINGISIKRDNWLHLNREDVKSELWIKAMEVILRTNQINLSVIARSCWNRINDICRITKKRNEKVVLSSEWLEKIETEDEVNEQKLSVEDDNMSKLVIDELLEIFPKDSLERRYITLMIFQTGLDEYLSPEELEEYQAIEESFDIRYKRKKEYKIARALGFMTDTNSNYRKLKQSVKETLIEKEFKISKLATIFKSKNDS